ncbi:hypothetical protein SAMN02910357_01285 [Succinivibrio dextrinosolvens]|uniref:hypothetical protein n=1 Tax=Succinivibrio dextrinosolvens TaxID=83771 RepID=UPI0008ECD680|nr:hypothetical protein [Succinivibrio dextrinosolvens]SFS62613.1 hypothetical protein SAMN02910357_01285 [Succinivibrio dextrinosolvens]
MKYQTKLFSNILKKIKSQFDYDNFQPQKVIDKINGKKDLYIVPVDEEFDPELKIKKDVVGILEKNRDEILSKLIKYWDDTKDKAELFKWKIDFPLNSLIGVKFSDSISESKFQFKSEELVNDTATTWFKAKLNIIDTNMQVKVSAMPSVNELVLEAAV